MVKWAAKMMLGLDLERDRGRRKTEDSWRLVKEHMVESMEKRAAGNQRGRLSVPVGGSRCEDMYVRERDWVVRRGYRESHGHMLGRISSAEQTTA